MKKVFARYFDNSIALVGFTTNLNRYIELNYKEAKHVTPMKENQISFQIDETWIELSTSLIVDNEMCLYRAI